MATQTQTIRRPPVQAGRVHDYLYDPHHVVSSERDHARATFKAHTTTNRVKRVPNYPTMFSELRHFPRFQMKLDVTDPVPKFISRQWRGYADQAREALVRHTTFNFDPSVKVPQKVYASTDVGGKERFKFFKKPIIPFLQQVRPDVILADARQDPLAQGGVDGISGRERPITPPTKTQMTQTDYRDSEAQTEPYTPEYVVRPGSQPELLTLATLSWGKGLPAGLAEVEMIERARTKRAWEATLPPLNDMSQIEKRSKMMDEMERKEWALREREIEKLQEARLEVLKQLLKQREEHHQELNTKRLDRLWARKQEEKENRVKRIRNEHIKTIRKLTEKRRKVEGKLERRDVTHDYSDPGSQVYAPLTRIGVFLDRGSEAFTVKSKYLNSYHGLLELEASLPDFVTQPRIKAPRPRNSTKAGHTKRKYRQEKQLLEMHDFIKEEKNKVAEPPKPLRFLTKIEKPIPRPPTPSVDIPSPQEEERELAVIFLQQVIRGRAIQNMMFEGKEKRIELIRELRSTHALQEAEQSQIKQEKQATLALQRQRRLHEHKENHVDESLAQLEGSSIGDTLDFLSKELIRLQEERRIHAFSMLAERQRRIREAEESGKRQLEERRRREEDEIFKQVVKVHQDTVDTYLEDIIISSIDCTAGTQARSEIQDFAKKINDVAYEMEDKRTALESEEIVAELVHGFLIPEVRKRDMRERVARKQRKHLMAAHKEIHGKGEQIIESMPHRTPKAAPVNILVVEQTTPRGQVPDAGSVLTHDQTTPSVTERLPSPPIYEEKYPKTDEAPEERVPTDGQVEQTDGQVEQTDGQVEQTDEQIPGETGTQTEKPEGQTQSSTQRLPSPVEYEPKYPAEQEQQAQEQTVESKEQTEESKEQTEESKEQAEESKEQAEESKEQTEESKEQTEESKEQTEESKE